MNSKFVLLALVLPCLLGIVLAADPIKLKRAEPHFEDNPKNGLDIYKLDPLTLEESQNLYFVLTPYVGDPDIYINCGTCPSLGEDNQMKDYKWKSTSSNDDLVVISKDVSCAAETEYCVAIHGHTAGKYSLVSYVTGDEIMLSGNTIVKSYSIIAASMSDEYARFSYAMPRGATNFTVSVTPIAGDPDLFIKEGSQPSKDDFHWKSRDFGFDVIDVMPEDEHYKADGHYHIAVLGFGSETLFSISISTHDDPVLIGDGVPIAGVVEEDEYDYYMFSVFEDQQHSLFFDLNTLGIESQGGDPDLYVAHGRKPTKDDHDYESRGFGHDFIQVKKSDVEKGTYYVGIHGFRKTTYQFIVYSEGNNVLLTAGIPISDQVSRDEYSYFKFRHEDDEAGLLFRTFTNRGKVSTYISEKITQPTKDPKKHEYASHAESDHESVVYVPSEENNEDWYWIGVYGDQSYNNFTLTVSTNQSVTLLEESKTSYFNRVPQKKYRYFTFITDNLKKDLTILLSPIVGDPDLYVSATIERPSTEHYTWKSTTGDTDAVTIHADDEKWKEANSGRIYIGVYGWTESIFNIRVFLSNETQELSENLLTPGTVEQDKYTYFSFEVPEAAHKVAFYVDMKLRNNDMDADLYVDTQEKPTKENHKWKSTNFGDDYLRVDDASSPPDGKFYVGVHGVTDASFTIVYATEMVQLYSTEAFLDSVPNGKYRNYRIDITDHVEAVLVTATLVDGVTELYLNTKTEGKPTRENNDFSDVHFPGNSLLITKADNPDKFETGEWVFSIHGAHESTYYVSYMEDFGVLSQGVPRLGATSSIYHPLYVHSLPTDIHGNVTEDYYVYVDVLNSEVDVFISQDHHQPNEEHHQWQSRGPGDHMVMLEKSKLKSGLLYVSVRPSSRIMGSGHFRFVVSINRRGAPLFLSSDVPQEKVTRPNEFSYFSVLTPAFQQADHSHKPNKTLEVTVESCTPYNAPLFYVGKNQTHPSHDDNDRASSVGDSQFVQYAALTNVQEKSIYHIGVDGGKNGTTYAIFATANVNQRPVPGNKGKLSGSYNKKKQTLSLELLDASGTTFPHYYSGYAMPYTTEGGDGSDVNFDTFCAVEVFGSVHGRKEIAGPHASEANKKFKMELTNLNADQIYAINILVEGGFSGSSTSTGPGGEGLKSVYKRVWLVKGEIRDSPLIKSGGYRFRVGWFLIGMSLGAFTLYVVIGVIVNAVRGARGLDLIPNYTFWKDLPFMIRDGVVFTFTCGRGRLSGASNYEDLDNSHSTNGEGPAGYGSI